MVAFGIEDGKKSVWQFMLGIGLAYNFGYALWEIFNGTNIFMSVDQIAQNHQATNATAEILKNSKENGNDDILTEIMAVYSGTIINNGMPVLQAIALRMTIALAAIEGGYKIAMDLYSGDKVKFIVATCFKVGFFCFLISEWLDIGQALSGFFQSAGFLAAGESGFSTVTPESADFDKTFRPDSIWHNAWAFIDLCLFGKKNWDAVSKSGFGFAERVEEDGVLGGVINLFDAGLAAIISPVVIIIVTIAIVGIWFLIAVEMFVARIEFYTMLMLSVVFLPFGVTERLAFLSNSAISLMFNSGAKMMVICFLQVMIAKIFSAYFNNLTANPFKEFSVLCQITIMSIFFLYIVKKIPELVSSFLNGSPALSGGGMIQQAKSTVAQAGMVVGGVSAAAAVGSGAAAATGGGKMSALKSTIGALGKAGAQNLMANNPFTQGYARGVKGVLGSDGSIRGRGAVENVGFMQGVRKLAGLEMSGQNKPTQSLVSRARYGDTTVDRDNVKGKPPTGSDGKPIPSSSFSKMPTGLQVKQHPDHGGKGVNISVGGNGGGSGNSTGQNIVSKPGMSKTTEKTKESTFRQESVHTSNEKNTQISTPGSGGNITHSTGTSNPVSGMQTNVTNNSSSTTTNISSNNSSGNNPDGGMSNLGNFGKK